jgi:NAD(P)-dependent dehydrogenase (short-subunit alcohol dehydrogenase family)
MSIFESAFSLKNSKILITGASSGIGREIAIIAAKHGAIIYAVGRNQKKLNLLKDIIGNKNCKTFSVDLTDKDNVTKLIEAIDSIDGLVNCAGLIKMSPYKFITQNSFSEIFDINVKAPVFLTTMLLKRRKINNSSSIVFISSINGSCIGAKGFTLYSTSKGAISGLVKSLAADLSKLKIRVNEIAPGMIITDGINSIEENISTSSIQEDMNKYPLGGYGYPDDVANGCVYLLSKASKWVTGTKLIIDGGFTLK